MPSVAGTTVAAPPSAGRAAGSRKAGWAATGGVLGALASMSCCILPLGLFFAGVSGAWIANLTALEPYQPVFFAVTAACLVAGYRQVYRRSAPACGDGTCERPLPRRVVKGVLWAATALVAAAVAFRYVGAFVLGIN